MIEIKIKNLPPLPLCNEPVPTFNIDGYTIKALEGSCDCVCEDCECGAGVEQGTAVSVSATDFATFNNSQLCECENTDCMGVQTLVNTEAISIGTGYIQI